MYITRRELRNDKRRGLKMLKFDLAEMKKVSNPEYLPIGSVIDVKTNFDDSELMLLVQVGTQTGLLICEDGNRWNSDHIILKMNENVQRKMVAYRCDLNITSYEKVNAYYIPKI